MRAAAACTSSRLTAYWAACLSGAMTQTWPILWRPVHLSQARNHCNTYEKRGMLAYWCLVTQPRQLPPPRCRERHRVADDVLGHQAGLRRALCGRAGMVFAHLDKEKREREAQERAAAQERGEKPARPRNKFDEKSEYENRLELKEKALTACVAQHSAPALRRVLCGAKALYQDVSHLFQRTCAAAPLVAENIFAKEPPVLLALPVGHAVLQNSSCHHLLLTLPQGRCLSATSAAAGASPAAAARSTTPFGSATLRSGCGLRN